MTERSMEFHRRLSQLVICALVSSTQINTYLRSVSVNENDLQRRELAGRGDICQYDGLESSHNPFPRCPTPTPSTILPSSLQELGEYQKLHLWSTGKVSAEVVQEYIGHMIAQSTWICFIKLQVLSPNQSAVDRLIPSTYLEIYLSSGFIKNYSLIYKENQFLKISAFIRMDIKYSF